MVNLYIITKHTILNSIIFNYFIGDSADEFTLKLWILHKNFK